MAFDACCECYPRSNHFRKRLHSIRPRFNNIINAEFQTRNLRETNADTKTIAELNKNIKDFSERECVHVVLIGEKSTRDLIPASRLVVKSLSDVTFSTDVKHPAIYVIVIEMDPQNKKKFDEDLHIRMAEVPESERKYVVIVIIPTKENNHHYDGRNMVETARSHTNVLEKLDSNFEFDKCVVMLPPKSVLKEQALKENKPVTREATKREGSKSPSSPYKTKVHSPPKRTFNPAETTQHADMSATYTPENPTESGSGYKPNAANEISDNKERKDDLPNEYDEKAIGKAISHQLESKGIDIVEEIESYLKHLKSRRDSFAGSAMFTDLDKMVFEFKGLYNVSETKKGRARKMAEKSSKLSEQLTADLLKLDLVRGCGRIYGMLNVHVEADADDDQRRVAKKAIESVITQHEYKLPHEVQFISSKQFVRSI